jgi:hypothetical protein
MTRPEDDLARDELAGLQQVQAAYRGLPPVEPDADLDARVRAAVAAVLAVDAAATANASAIPAAIPASGPAGPGRVVPFPHWRRVALPLAAAASLVIGVGLWRMRAPPEAMTASVVEAPAASQPATPAELPEQLELKAARAAVRAQAPRGRAESDGAALQAMADAAPAAPAADQGTARAYGPSEAARKRSPANPAGATFDAIRLLLAQHRRDEARALLEQWRATHAQAPVPTDLQPLLDAVQPRDAAR